MSHRANLGFLSPEGSKKSSELDKVKKDIDRLTTSCVQHINEILKTDSTASDSTAVKEKANSKEFKEPFLELHRLLNKIYNDGNLLEIMHKNFKSDYQENFDKLQAAFDRIARVFINGEAQETPLTKGIEKPYKVSNELDKSIGIVKLIEIFTKVQSHLKSAGPILRPDFF